MVMEAIALLRDAVIVPSDLEAVISSLSEVPNDGWFTVMSIFRALPLSKQSKDALIGMASTGIFLTCPFDLAHRVKRQNLCDHLCKAHFMLTPLFSSGQKIACSPPKSKYPITVFGRLHSIKRGRAVIEDMRLEQSCFLEGASYAQKLFTGTARLVVETVYNIHGAVQNDVVSVQLLQDADKVLPEMLNADSADCSSIVSGSNATGDDNDLEMLRGARPSNEVESRHEVQDLYGRVTEIICGEYRKEYFVCLLDPKMQFTASALRDQFLVFSSLDPRYNLLAVPLPPSPNDELSLISRFMDTKPALTQCFYVVNIASRNDPALRGAVACLKGIGRQLRLATYVKCFDDVVAINNAIDSKPDVWLRIYQMTQHLALYENGLEWALKETTNDECAAEARVMYDRWNVPLSKGVVPSRYVDHRDLYCFSVMEDYSEIDHLFSIAPTPDHMGLRLGVHIADIASFLKVGGAIDAVARCLGGSLYLPMRPMQGRFIPTLVCFHGCMMVFLFCQGLIVQLFQYFLTSVKKMESWRLVSPKASIRSYFIGLLSDHSVISISLIAIEF